MKNKFIIQTLDETSGDVISNYECKTLREIAVILDIDYHQARLLYLHNKKPTKLHPYLMARSKRFKIIDNPDLFDNIKLPTQN